jgi:hypothetical protein
MDEVLNNRLEEPGGKLESRLRERIIAPMRKIAIEDVDVAVLALDRSRRVSQKPDERAAALKEARATQAQIVKTMQDILANMAKAEGYQEAINLLYELEKAQKDVLDKTEQEKKERIKRILEGGKAAEEKPLPEKPAAEQPNEEKPDGAPPQN